MVCAPVRRDNPRGAQTMLYLTCATISSVDLAHYGVSLAKDWVSLECGTISPMCACRYVYLIFMMRDNFCEFLICLPGQ